MHAAVALPLALAFTSTVMGVATFALASLLHRRENIFAWLCTWIWRFGQGAAWLYGASLAAYVAQRLMGAA